MPAQKGCKCATRHFYDDSGIAEASKRMNATSPPHSRSQLVKVKVTLAWGGWIGESGIGGHFEVEESKPVMWLGPGEVVGLGQRT